MRCPRCEAENPDENRFCTNCGASLREGAAPEAPRPVPDSATAQQLIDLAFQYSDQGLLAEAIQAAEQAVAANPSSTSAHSLLGILYERAGERQKAIAEYERALALSPRSAADQQALQQLLQAMPTARRRVSPAVARGAIIGAFVLLLVLVPVLVWMALRPAWQRPELARPQPLERRVAAPVSPAPGQTGAAIPAVPAMPAAPAAPPPAAPAPAAASVLPLVRMGAPVAAPAERTARAPEAETLPRTLRAPLLSSPGPVPAPFVVPPPARRLEPPLPPAPQPIVATTELARTYYLLGDYDKAIGTYERYVSKRPDAAPQVREELAFCFYRKDRLAEARVEYERALRSYEAELASGQNQEDAAHGARTCRAALRALEAQ